MRIAGLALLLSAALAGCRATGAPPSTIPHPDRPGTAIEYFEAHPPGNGPWPTIVLLHGHQGPTARIGGRAFQNWGELDRYAKAGYLAVAVSLPGYGGSGGPEDYAGPFTQHAVEAVIARLEAAGEARRDRVLIEGVSLGAVTAALIGAHRSDIAGLVLISGLYDFPAFFAQTRSAGASGVRLAVTLQTGGDTAALSARSALPLAAQIHARTLILNGARDDRTDPTQAMAFATAIRAGGGDATAHIFPDYGHEIPVRARQAEIDAFIGATLRP